MSSGGVSRRQNAGVTGTEAPLPQHPIARLLVETTKVLVLITVAYYLLPLRLALDDWRFVPRSAGSLLAVAALGLLLRSQIRRSQRLQSRELIRVQWLLTVLYMLVLVFALSYAVAAALDPGAFAGVGNRTSALYFSLTVVSTVGLGDVHPSNTFGQAVVSCQMLFDMLYIGTALRILSHNPSRLTGREDG